MREYDLIADWYASNRGGEAGVPEVSALAASLPSGARVLDAGCGTGVPLTLSLVQQGCRVVGLDSSARMLATFRRRLPSVPAVQATLQSCPIAEACLDAVLAWGVIFHLDHDEQRRALAEVSRVLEPGGLFLFTAGDEDGSIEGEPMDGVPFFYHSFSVDGYRALLREHGLRLQETHADAGGNTSYLAQKRG